MSAKQLTPDEMDDIIADNTLVELLLENDFDWGVVEEFMMDQYPEIAYQVVDYMHNLAEPH